MAITRTPDLLPISFRSQLVPALFDIFQLVQELLKRQLHDGLYEVLTYESVLELQDPTGENAVFRKHHRVKFLQDHVIAYQDYVWGEGNLFADYQCSPGTVVDRYKEGNRWNVLISLRETKSRGDIEDFHIERRIINGFLKSEEYWQMEMQHETRWLKLSIVFPAQRRCKRAVLTERMRNRTTEFEPDQITELSNGRQVLTWQTPRPRRFETYTIKWWW